MLQPTDYEWKVPEATKSRDVSRAEETEKVDEDVRHNQCRRGRGPRRHSGGFPPVSSPHCINMTRTEDYKAYLRQVVLEFERLIKS